jgi:Holliday junction resolvasome RuvABC endonuclease subunit
MRRVWLGIDPGLKTTGLAIVGDIEEKRVGRPRPTLAFSSVVKGNGETDRIQRTSDLADDVVRGIERLLNDTSAGRCISVRCAIEEPFIGPNARGALLSYGLYAVICDRLWRADCGSIVAVNPSSLKRFVGAKTKDFVLRQAFRKFGFAQASHDAVDALLLAMYAWSLGEAQ